MLEIIEAVEGPMIGQLSLDEQTGGEKFGLKVEQVYEKAVAQARAILEKAKLSSLIQA